MHAKHGAKVSFTGKNIYYVNSNISYDPAFSVAPDANAEAKSGPAGRVLRLLQHVCGYEELSFNGIQVTGSVVTGTQTTMSDGSWTAAGYEWFCLINGDRVLAEISETGNEKGSEGKVKIVQGTGSLAGITGEGTYSNTTKPGQTIIVSLLTGWYSLPAAKAAGAAA